MARTDHTLRTVPSLLDRLLDEAPDETHERSVDEYQRVRDLKRAVCRDLEALLNTRREAIEDIPEGLTEVEHSIATYGLPDFSALDLRSQTDRMRVRRAVEQILAVFEPRLERVRVIMKDPRPFDRGLHFRIDAMLRLDPTPEPVTFDAVLQLATQEYRVQGTE